MNDHYSPKGGKRSVFKSYTVCRQTDRGMETNALQAMLDTHSCSSSSSGTTYSPIYYANGLKNSSYDNIIIINVIVIIK